MRNIIKHKPVTELIGPGEIAIDTDARSLKLNTFRGEVTLPLDFVALELLDENASSQVYVYRDDGVARIADYDAGGGGTAFDGKPWRVPGLTPLALGSLAVATTAEALFEIARPTTISGLRLRVESGSGDLGLSILNADGSSVGAWLEQADAPGDVVRAVNLTLDPGRYISRVSVTGSVTLRTVDGRLPWLSDLQRHPMMMEIV